MWYKILDQWFIMNGSKINRWNISDDINVGNDDNCAFPLSKMSDTGWLP